MLLLIILPFVVTDLENNDTYSCFLHLRKIVLILLGYKLSAGQVIYLKSLISEYLEYRQELFPDVPLKPKHHFISHYTDIINQFGPLRYLWTLRFEAKHQCFKRAVRHSNNFINILFSLSHRHQLLQSLNMSQQKLFEDKVIYNEHVDKYDKQIFSDTIATIIEQNVDTSHCFVSYEVTYRGVKYEKDMCVCYDRDLFGAYVICQVKHIIINTTTNKIFFIGVRKCIVCNTDGLYYNVDDNDPHEYVFVNFKDLLSPETLLYRKHIHFGYQYYFRSIPFENI